MSVGFYFFFRQGRGVVRRNEMSRRGNEGTKAQPWIAGILRLL